MTLIAYHGNQVEKDAILAQLRAHRIADELVKGQYWQDGKGCAVGCTLHSGNHAEYEPRFGVPVMLARLEDAIFEGLPNGDAQAWPERFMDAIRPGADLSRVGWQLLYWLLTDEAVNPGIRHSLVVDAVKQCALVVETLAASHPIDPSAARSAESAAWSAESAAASAWRAASAVASAAASAWRAARSAESAAASAAESAAASAAESAAASA